MPFRYGRDHGVFSFEIGEVAQLGIGAYYLQALRPEDIFRAVDG